MDESMNSVHSISAMDISPASSPQISINPMPSNQFVLNAFQQQQELLTNILFNQPIKNDYSIIDPNSFPDDEDLNSKSVCLYSTVLTENTDESNQLRQRLPITKIESTISSNNKSESNSSHRTLNKILFLIPIFCLIIYIFIPHWNPSIVLPRSSDWQNASKYLTKNLLGQEQGLQQFQDLMEKHKNFSVVLIEGPIGTGKTYLASSLEKFIPTTLISTNTLLLLSSQYWTDSNRLSSYLQSHLTPSSFQFLILDDFDLLSKDEQFCQTLITALQSLNDKKNLIILLLQTGPMSTVCKETLDILLTKSIQFQMLQRHHIRLCIQNEAYSQNIQPTFNEKQIENILNSLKYVKEDDISYSTTGCKNIPSLVMLETSKKTSVEN